MSALSDHIFSLGVAMNKAAALSIEHGDSSANATVSPALPSLREGGANPGGRDRSPGLSFHTPGPWGLATGYERGDKSRQFVWSHAELAEDRDDDSPHCIAIVCPREREAVLDGNARLIAAAPDLLAALQSALPRLQALCDVMGGADNLAAFNQALGALAKVGAA